MSGTQVEVFSLGATTPDSLPLHGSALVRLDAQGVARLHRGIDLQAGAELEARFQGEVGDALKASLTVGADAKLQAALQAAVPLDLFTAAGVIARLELAAEAAVFVGLDVRLAADEFEQLVRARLGEGLLVDLLDIFLDETEIGAGVWARAAFAAELVGEASLTGSLLPTGDQPAGVSFALRYGAGVAYGAGANVVAQFGFADSRRLLRRTSDRVTSGVVTAARTYAGSLGVADEPAAREAVGVLRLLVPLATRSAFELGSALASAQDGDHAAAAAEAVGRSFVSCAQATLLQGVLDVVLAEIDALLGGVPLIDAYLALDESDRVRALDALNGVADALATVVSLEEPDAAVLIDAFMECVAALWDIGEIGLVPAADRDRFEHVTAVVYAAAVAAERVALVAEGQASVLFDSSPARTAGSGAVVAFVATAVGKQSGALTVVDAVEYLLDQAPLDRLASAQPEVAGALAWLVQALGETDPRQLLHRLLVDLASPAPAALQDLLAGIGQAIGVAVDDLLPNLLEPLKSHDPNAPIVEILDAVVTPTLVVLPRVVLPRLPELASDPDAPERLTEVVSLVLLQLVGRLVLASVDTLAEHALSGGEQAARDLAASVGGADVLDPSLAPLTAAAARAALSFTLTPGDIERTLGLIADTAKLANDELRGPLVQSLETVLGADLSDPARRDASFAAVADTDAPPDSGALSTALSRLEDGSLDLAGEILLGVLEILGMHLVDEAEAVAALVYEGVRPVVEAVEEAVTWLGEQLEQLQARAEELGREIEQALERLAGEIAVLAAHLETLLQDVLEAIRADGWKLAQPLVGWLPEAVQDAVHEVYDALFDGVESLLEAPLAVLGNVADWVSAELLAQAQAGTVDAATAATTVRNRILGSSALDLTIPLDVDLGLLGTYDLGSVTIPHSVVLGSVASTSLNDQSARNTVSAAASIASDLSSLQAQKAAVARAVAEETTKEAEEAAVAGLASGAPVTVTFDPDEAALHERDHVVAIRVEGANPTFVDTTLGVPRRISVFVNGSPYSYAPADWRVVGEAIELELRVIAPVAPSPATPGRPRAMPLVALHLDAYTSIADLTAMTPRRGAVVQRPTVPSLRARGSVTVTPVAAAPRLTLVSQPAAAFAAAFRGVAPRAAGMVVGRTGLNVLQVAVSDGRDPGRGTAGAATRFYLRAAGADESPDVVIEDVVADVPGRDVGPDGEHVVLRSRSATLVELGGWRLRDAAGHEYRFPDGTLLAPGTALTVYTGRGQDDPWSLHWGRRAAVWNNRGAETACLLDTEGREVARKVVR